MLKKVFASKGAVYILKSVIIIMLILLIWWTLLPLSLGIMHPGIVLLCSACVFLIFVVIFAEKIKEAEKGRLKVPIIIFKSAACVLLAAFIFMSALMLGASTKKPPQGVTVIVPGAQINGDTVSLILEWRLLSAIDYLNENPGSYCIVTGGQGPNELYTEAEVMKKYLTEHGIDENRVYVENRAVNTEENIKYSAEIIKNNSLPQKTAIATDTFHEFRCAYEARKNGLVPYAVPCRTIWYLLPGYWVREMMAICKAVLL